MVGLRFSGYKQRIYPAQIHIYAMTTPPNSLAGIIRVTARETLKDFYVSKISVMLKDSMATGVDALLKKVTRMKMCGGEK